MSLSAQAKVLRVLQESMISRVGAEKDIKVDVRVIAATNKDLKTKLPKAVFVRIYIIDWLYFDKVPSLNERREDIPKLISFCRQLLSKEMR
jgi:transcriptional regulator with GAF, ATPase, and Fis domain